MNDVRLFPAIDASQFGDGAELIERRAFLAFQVLKGDQAKTSINNLLALGSYSGRNYNLKAFPERSKG
jgi:hypothetical protein